MLSHEWWEYHLTPRGWEDGRSKEDHRREEVPAIPDDRVMSIRVEEMQTAAFTGSRELTVIYRDSNEELVRQLRAKFGQIPGRLKTLYPAPD